MSEAKAEGITSAAVPETAALVDPAARDFVMVPRVPTLEMLTAYWRAVEAEGTWDKPFSPSVSATRRYCAMLAAAPEAPAAMDTTATFGSVFKDLVDIVRDVMLSITVTPEADIPKALDDIYRRAYTVMGRVGQVSAAALALAENTP